MNPNRRLAVAALVGAGLLWGTTVPLSKLALQWLPPGGLTATRFGLAAAVLLAFVQRTRPRLRAAARPALRLAGRPGLRTGGRPGMLTGLRSPWSVKVLVSGAIGYGGSVLMQNAGIARTSVTHAALLIGAVPVMVAVVAALWQHTVARPVAWVGFAISLAGVGLVTADGGGGGATLTGDGLVLASLLVSAVFTVGQARLLRGRDPVAVTAVQFLGAALGALTFTVITERMPAAPTSAGPVLAVTALAVGGTLLPFTLFAYGQSRVSAEVAGAFYNLEPLVGAAAGAVLFGNPVGIALVGGGAAIVAGIGLSSLPLVAAARPATTCSTCCAASGQVVMATTHTGFGRRCHNHYMGAGAGWRSGGAGNDVGAGSRRSAGHASAGAGAGGVRGVPGDRGGGQRGQRRGEHGGAVDHLARLRGGRERGRAQWTHECARARSRRDDRTRGRPGQGAGGVRTGGRRGPRSDRRDVRRARS